MSVEKAFLDADGDFDVCINCAAETRYGQSEEVNIAKCFIQIYFTCCKKLLVLLTVALHVFCYMYPVMEIWVAQ